MRLYGERSPDAAKGPASRTTAGDPSSFAALKKVCGDI
jgi:hypothetical protein